MAAPPQAPPVPPDLSTMQMMAAAPARQKVLIQAEFAPHLRNAVSGELRTGLFPAVLVGGPGTVPTTAASAGAVTRQVLLPGGPSIADQQGARALQKKHPGRVNCYSPLRAVAYPAPLGLLLSPQPWAPVT